VKLNKGTFRPTKSDMKDDLKSQDSPGCIRRRWKVRASGRISSGVIGLIVSRVPVEPAKEEEVLLRPVQFLGSGATLLRPATNTPEGVSAVLLRPSSTDQS
jgi:hypothetical protein